MRRLAHLLALGALASLDAAAQPAPPALQNALRLSAAGSYDSAAVALEAIVADGKAGVPRALQELLGVYARASRLDDAYRALQRARAFGVDLSMLAARPDVATLRGDARFAELFPDSASFAHPFVERMRIIHEWRGEHAGDEFGWIARGIGDVDGDGDGAADFLVTSAYSLVNGVRSGRVYIVAGTTRRQALRR